MKKNWHESVMVDEVIEALHIKQGDRYIDATLGNGGHTIEIEKIGGIVLGIDADPEMISITQKRIGVNKNIILETGNFIDIDKIAKNNNFEAVSGILFDLGVSNIHLKSNERGFSFENSDAILDMRLDQTNQSVRACDLLNALREDHLIKLFGTVMDPSSTRWITKKVIERRNISFFQTVKDMLIVCEDLRGKIGLNPATLPFLALRIAVNSELENLKIALSKAYELLKKEGKLVVISFHSGEDSIVRKFMDDRKEYKAPSVAEIMDNPRSRSARLRVLTK